MRKIAVLIICLALMSFISIPVMAQTYTTNLRSKAIHIVYDDSGSMIKDNGVYVERWGQAKYAMEVFAVMLERNDTMRVYYMSDFDTLHNGKINASPRIDISGSEPADSRVAKVHNTVTYAWNTPYDTVAKAYADLINTDADVKWLVVLTDGEFNQLNGRQRDPEKDPVPVDKFFSQYVEESGVKIILLAMGDVTDAFKLPVGRDGIYFEQAKDADEILGKVTSISNRIFNRNKLKFTNEARYEFNFDIPMEELLVFAQGANIKINGIKGSDTYNPSGTVNVRYSDKAAQNYANDPVKKSTNLTGVIASFNNISKGAYSLNITGARTVEVYYKPVVIVDINLYHNRMKVRKNEITEGKYQIQYGIIDENGKFFESSLLGNVEYTATVQNNGQTTLIKSGDAVNLSQGDLKVHVQAHFLEINTAENTVTAKVLAPLPFKERFRNWIKAYWFIFWPLVYLLLGLLLYWILWGQKKRFPRYMSKKPEILVETEENSYKDYGTFKIIPNTIWMPFCPERGTIVAAAGGKPLPTLKVKAVDDNRMELTNTSDFSADKLNGVDFFINEQPLPEGSTRNKEMSCTSIIKSVYYGAGSATTHICSFAKNAKKGKKRRK